MPDDPALDVDAFLGVLNHLNDAVYITDRTRKILLWNRKAEEITGWPADEIVGSHCFDNVLNHVDKAGNRLCTTDLCPLHRAIVTEQASHQPLLVFARCKDGRRVPVSVSVAPLRDDDGNVVGGIEVFRDETERLADLSLARQIQASLLPQALPADGKIRFDAYYHPYDLIGGDFYDIRALPGRRYAFLVADVRGHGVSAALYTMLIKSLGERHPSDYGQPGAFMTLLNRELAVFPVEAVFATAFYGVVDTCACRVTYTSAGHPPALLYHASDAGITELEAHDLPLGIDPNVTYGQTTVPLSSGDLLVCYTDGITDVTDKKGELLGVAGLNDLVRREMAERGGLSMQRVYQRALAACGEVALDDDVLLLSVRRITDEECRRIHPPVDFQI